MAMKILVDTNILSEIRKIPLRRADNSVSVCASEMPQKIYAWPDAAVQPCYSWTVVQGREDGRGRAGSRRVSDDGLDWRADPGSFRKKASP
jgi:hypothetical protein